MLLLFLLLTSCLLTGYIDLISPKVMKTLFMLGLLCVLAASACITRQDAVNRAMEWVNAHIPYNASAYHGGYIQGCEGIVGYA